MDRKFAPKPEDVAIGAQLHAVRKEMNLSQTKVAEMLGVSFQQVQKYEKGDNRVPVAKLSAFANAVGIDIRRFLAPAGTPSPVAPVELEAFRQTVATSLRVFDRLADEINVQRNLLRDIVARIAEPASPAAAQAA